MAGRVRTRTRAQAGGEEGAPGGREAPAGGSEFPDGAFSAEERRRGAIVLHVVGMFYMFVALAIVCDEFFVPTLELLAEIMDLRDDVAGATLMAAGGSAPELFISFMGNFVAKSNVGFGTIIGSAVFNVLFVIGMCAVFSREVLKLTWWPLFRDSLFYTVDLVVLLAFFQDGKIDWWEAGVMLALYCVYVGFMSVNERVEERVMAWLRHRRQNSRAVSPAREAGEAAPDEAAPGEAAPDAPPKVAVAAADSDAKAGLGDAAEGAQPGGHRAVRRTGVQVARRVRRFSDRTPDVEFYQDDGLIEFSPPRVKLRLSTWQMMFRQSANSKGPNRGLNRFKAAANLALTKHVADQAEVAIRTSLSEHGGAEVADGGGKPSLRAMAAADGEQLGGGADGGKGGAEAQGQGSEVVITPVSNAENGGGSDGGGGEGWSKALGAGGGGRDGAGDGDGGEGDGSDGEGAQPLELTWPDSTAERVSFALTLPITACLYYTVPDVRREGSRKYVVVGFVMSITWIAVYTYFMVWFATLIGETAGVPDAVMGLTFLAAGTSVPDLFSSIIVAKQGLGDMAVSSSVGSNIFDVTMGLPLPWIIRSAVDGGRAVSVESGQLGFSLTLLLIMLVTVVVSIMASNWMLGKRLGYAMFMLYGIFLLLSLLAEGGVIKPNF